MQPVRVRVRVRVREGTHTYPKPYPNPYPNPYRKPKPNPNQAAIVPVMSGVHRAACYFLWPVMAQVWVRGLGLVFG